jgi:hypothetical protein
LTFGLSLFLALELLANECGGWPRRQLSAPSPATKVRVLSLRFTKNDLDPETDFDEHP